MAADSRGMVVQDSIGRRSESSTKLWGPHCETKRFPAIGESDPGLGVVATFVEELALPSPRLDPSGRRMIPSSLSLCRVFFLPSRSVGGSSVSEGRVFPSGAEFS
jgi:hypothetical protein